MFLAAPLLGLVVLAAPLSFSFAAVAALLSFGFFRLPPLPGSLALGCRGLTHDEQGTRRACRPGKRTSVWLPPDMAGG